MGSLPCNCCLTGNHGRPFAGHHLILLLFGLRSAVSQIDMQSPLLGIIYLSSLSNLAIGDSQQDPSLGISEISDYICRRLGRAGLMPVHPWLIWFSDQYLGPNPPQGNEGQAMKCKNLYVK
ncbi:hypothetical protein AAC387_Pa07g1159 [Persea americana]